MTEKQIQTAVARADLILCTALRWAGAAALCTVILLACLIGLYTLARAGPRPDAHDITSEGPEGDYTPAFYQWKEENP